MSRYWKSGTATTGERESVGGGGEKKLSKRKSADKERDRSSSSSSTSRVAATTSSSSSRKSMSSSSAAAVAVAQHDDDISSKKRRVSAPRRRSTFHESESDEERPHRRQSRVSLKDLSPLPGAPIPDSSKVRFADESARKHQHRTSMIAADAAESSNKRASTHETALAADNDNSGDLGVPLHELIDSRKSEQERLLILLTMQLEEAEVDVAFQHKRTPLPAFFKKIKTEFLKTSEEAMQLSLRSGVRIAKIQPPAEPMLEHPQNVMNRAEEKELLATLHRYEREIDEWQKMVAEANKNKDEEEEEEEEEALAEFNPLDHLRDADIEFLDGRATKVMAEKLRECRHALNAELEVLRQGVAGAKTIADAHDAQLKILRAAARNASYAPYHAQHQDAKSLLQGIAVQ